MDERRDECCAGSRSGGRVERRRVAGHRAAAPGRGDPVRGAGGGYEQAGEGITSRTTRPKREIGSQLTSGLAMWNSLINWRCAGDYADQP